MQIIITILTKFSSFPKITRNINAIMVDIAKNAKDIYGLLVVTGVAFMFAFQIIENIGMTIGIMPVTGVTLPFLSYGGSSLITSMIAVGLVLNVSMRNKKIRF